MNIVFLDQFSDLGGAQQCLLELMPAIRDCGWNAIVALPGDGPLIRKLRDAGAQVEPIRCGPYTPGRKLPSDLLRFAADFMRLTPGISRLADRHDAGLIYVNGPRLLPAAAAAVRGRTRLVFHSHSRLSRRYAARLAGASLRLARASVIAASRFVAQPLLSYVGPERCHIVYNGVAGPAPGQKAAPGLTGAWRIGVIGRVAPEKGQEKFMLAARLLHSHIPDARFVVCGSTLFGSTDGERYFERVRRLAEGLPVEFVGWTEDVYAVLSCLDLLVVPSLTSEGTTRVILEAYAAGVPVVAYCSGGIAEVVADGQTGFLVDALTPEALAERIRDLIAGSPERLRQTVEAGRIAWREKYTLNRYRQQIVQVIGKLV